MMCEIFTWEESQGRKREPLDPTPQVAACARREGTEQHCFERAEYCSSTQETFTQDSGGSVSQSFPLEEAPSLWNVPNLALQPCSVIGLGMSCEKCSLHRGRRSMFIAS